MPAGLALHTVTSQTVRRHLKYLKNSRSLGTDGIPIHFWKNTVDVLIAPLTDLINACITQGKVPEAWKESVIHPMGKKNKDSLSMDAYRPISILNALSKVLESVVQAQLKAFLEEFNSCRRPSTASGGTTQRRRPSPWPCRPG